ncbi:PPOX class probable F420-dependent enzyme [Halopolyspora algeriensis]|uniref:PPOX class probable F420-dependent enzyme n=1 Tax=Halopolyspora algeriensis TaxID=1500506 RepID=A0A368VVD3_9ACTN|nr:PPOX class F420-dependent oxidoreductase [Halopolyspora algeriensis]RCW44056.1 PPOX class probable F420-dependent enzyme [Halopolyspora algeriensis]TQM53445.1 PPOX class probable F420-dependent enzyme [Halopolyspora algeriensis]
MAAITDERVRGFLEESARTGKLGYTAADGRPLVVPVWYALDGDEVVFTTGKDSAKGASIARDPRLVLCVDKEDGHKFAQIQGEAVTTEDPGEVLRAAVAIAARYVSPDKAEKVGNRIASPGQLAVRLRPTKVVTSDNLRD